MENAARVMNVAAVRKLCELWPEMNREEYHDVLTTDALYINMPRLEQRRVGPDAAFEALEPWRARCRIGLEILHIQGDESVVMCERLERFESRADDRVIELYVTGVFEMTDGKIAKWRDYYEGSHAPSALFQG